MNVQYASKIRIIQDKHDIVEMAKGKIGLKWPSMYYLKLQTTSTKQIRKKKQKQKQKHAPKLSR